jgi:hypothetical protein
VRGGLVKPHAGVVVRLEEERGARLRLDLDWGQQEPLNMIAGDPAIGVAAAGESKDAAQDASARFDAVAATGEA